MIFRERCHSIDIRHRDSHVFHLFCQYGWVALGERIQYFEIDWIIRHAGDVIALIFGNCIDSTFKNFSCHKSVDALEKLEKKARVDVFGGVDPETVNGVGLDGVVCPFDQEILDLLVFCEKIWQRHDQITCLTQLRIGHIVPVCDFAVGMEVVSVVEGSEDGIVDVCGGIAAIGDVSHVIDHRIHHKIHPAGV